MKCELKVRIEEREDIRNNVKKNINNFNCRNPHVFYRTNDHLEGMLSNPNVKLVIVDMPVAESFDTPVCVALVFEGDVYSREYAAVTIIDLIDGLKFSSEEIRNKLSDFVFEIYSKPVIINMEGKNTPGYTSNDANMLLNMMENKLLNNVSEKDIANDIER